MGQCEADEGIEKRYKHSKEEQQQAQGHARRGARRQHFQNLFAKEILHTVGTEAAADHNERAEIEKRRTLVPSKRIQRR